MEAIVELTLDTLAHGGEALGHFARKVIFVPYAIPGERVRVEIVEEKERWARGRLLEVLTPSPDRIVPPCPYFGPGQCSGCQLQHIAYARQVTLKTEVVADQLRRLGHVAKPPVLDAIVLAGEEGLLAFGYRNQTRFAMTAEGHVGYRRAGSHDVIAIESCPLLAPVLDNVHAALDVAWSDLRGIGLKAGINTDQALVVFEAAGSEQPELEVELPVSCVVETRQGLQPLVGAPWIEEEVAGRLYRVSAGSHFEANTAGAEALVALVRGYAEGPADGALLDLYAGTGLFSLSLADLFPEVVAVEESPFASEDFAVNGDDLENVSLHEGPVSDVLPALAGQNLQAAVAVVTPPQEMGVEVVAGLAALHPQRIIYVAHDPAVLARDGVHLSGAGYRLVEVQPVDLYPQTFRIAAVAVWDRMR